MIRVLSANAGADTGGVSWGIVGAFRRHGPDDLIVRSAIRSTNYIDYPHDLDWQVAGSYAASADVLHVHNTTRTLDVLAAGRKPFVLHHHGTHFREHSGALKHEVRRLGGVAVVSTLDLLDFDERLMWVPAALDLDELAAIRETYARPAAATLRVGHAPTNRAIKSTGAFIAACDRLGVESVVIERAPWADCLREKATFDVYFDQVQLGYGQNAIEAWGMGIPVIAGAAPATLARMAETFGDLPFMTATEDTIADALEVMLVAGVRDAWAERGRVHVGRWHDGRETVRRLAPIYRELANA